MRIAYVTLYFVEHHAKGGVGEKIKTHKRIWENLGHEVKFFFLSPEDLIFEESKSFSYASDAKFAILKFIARFISRSRALIRLIHAIKAYQPDLIYFRQSIYIYPLQRIFDLAPVVLELNANDVSEIQLRGWVIDKLHRFTRHISFKKSSGFVFTSYELAENLRALQYKQPFRVIGNGIDFKTHQELPCTSNSAPTITIVGTPGMTWHGVDKLIYLAQTYPDLTINIIGYQPKDIGDIKLPNLHLFGFLPREKVRDVLKMTDVVCGTLALHRKAMYEASPLKVREAAAYGIPLILAYHDTDLSGIDEKHILQISNDEENVKSHADQIYRFAYQMIGKRLNRSLIQNQIDQRQKEIERIQLFYEAMQYASKKLR